MVTNARGPNVDIVWYMRSWPNAPANDRKNNGKTAPGCVIKNAVASINSFVNNRVKNVKHALQKFMPIIICSFPTVYRVNNFPCHWDVNASKTMYKLISKIPSASVSSSLTPSGSACLVFPYMNMATPELMDRDIPYSKREYVFLFTQ